MRKLTVIGLLTATVLGVQGCGVALLVGAAAYAAKEDKNSKLDFERLNLDRESAGLQPLRWNDYKKGRNQEPSKKTD